MGGGLGYDGYRYERREVGFLERVADAQRKNPTFFSRFLSKKCLLLFLNKKKKIFFFPFLGVKFFRGKETPELENEKRFSFFDRISLGFFRLGLKKGCERVFSWICMAAVFFWIFSLAENDFSRVGEMSCYYLPSPAVSVEVLITDQRLWSRTGSPWMG